MPDVKVTSSEVATISVTPTVTPSVSAESGGVQVVNVNQSSSEVKVFIPSPSLISVSPVFSPLISVNQLPVNPINVTAPTTGLSGPAGPPGPAGGVSSVNSLTGGITLSAGDNVSISDDGSNTVTISSSSTGGGETDLSKTVTSSNITVISSSGDDVVLPAATTTDAGLLTASKFADIVNNTAKTGITSEQANAITDNTAKTGITQAQANAITANTDKVSADDSVTTHSDVTNAGSGAIITADERTKLEGVDDRANHTGNQPASTISDFDTEVANNSAVSANSDKVSSKVNVTSAQPTSASDFTIGGVEYELLFDESATSSQAFLYGLNSGSTAIYRATMSRSTILTLDVTSFVLQDSSGDTIDSGTSNIYEIGATTNIFKENCEGFNANYNNVSGGTLSGTNTISVTNRSSSQGWGSSALTVETSDLTAGTPQTLVDFRGGTAQADFDVYYPNDTTWDSSERKTLRFSLTANDGTTQDTASLTFYFKNRVFHGGSSNSSLTSSQIIDLSNSPFTGSDFSLSETSVTTSGTQYYYYCYPSRLSGTPIFKIGPNPTDFTALTDVSVTNSSGYVETYKVFQSPEQYTNASFTLTVET